MALGGNPVFNSKNYREQTRAAGPAGATPTAYAQPGMSPQALQDLYSQPSASPIRSAPNPYAPSWFCATGQVRTVRHSV